MIRVGQCESCQCWYRARHLTAARVAKPMIADRERVAEAYGAIPGIEAPIQVAYFCSDCLEAIQVPGEDESLIWKPGDPAPERGAGSRTRARAGVVDDAE